MRIKTFYAISIEFHPLHNFLLNISTGKSEQTCNTLGPNKPPTQKVSTIHLKRYPQFNNFFLLTKFPSIHTTLKSSTPKAIRNYWIIDQIYAENLCRIGTGIFHYHDWFENVILPNYFIPRTIHKWNNVLDLSETSTLVFYWFG